MAVSKRGNSWQARVEYRDAQGVVHKLTGTAQTKAAARDIESQLLRRREVLRRGPDSADNTDAPVAPTFTEALAAYEDWRGCSDKVREKHRSHVMYRLTAIADVRMDALTRSALSDLQCAIAGSAYSSAVRNECIQLVRAVCRYYSALSGAPDPSIMMHGVPQSSDEILRVALHPVLTPSQFDNVAKCSPSPYREFFTVLFWTGMRRGELIALFSDDVDTANHRLRVGHSQRNATQERKLTKTKQVRWVAIDDVTWLTVEALYESSPGPYLFGGERPLSPTTLDRQWHDALSAATAADPSMPQITIHGLRHSHATWLINNGVNIVAVSKRLGHASIEQTLRTYAHLLDDTAAQCVSFISDYRSANSAD